MDDSLAYAYATWKPALESGVTALEAGELSKAVSLLSDALRISASFHPVYHFLETGLNTELARLLYQAKEMEKVMQVLDRAIFLHHDNPAALYAKQLLVKGQLWNPVPYYFLKDCQSLAQKGEIFRLYAHSCNSDDLNQKIIFLKQAIEICEETHKHYHRLAAVPWVWRARAFLAQGEEMLPLARNDIWRGLDLDKLSAELLALHLQTTTANH